MKATIAAGLPISITLYSTESFVDYVKRHGSLANATIWCSQLAAAASLKLTAILNDNGDYANGEELPAWRDHVATYTPQLSVEWSRWTGKNGQKFSQSEFAEFIEENSKDIVSVEGRPSGKDMLEMALSFEANQDSRFKSAIRLQNGGTTTKTQSSRCRHMTGLVSAYPCFGKIPPPPERKTKRRPITGWTPDSATC